MDKPDSKKIDVVTMYFEVSASSAEELRDVLHFLGDEMYHRFQAEGWGAKLLRYNDDVKH